MMIIFEKSNPALSGFLASRNLYFNECVEDQTYLLLFACLWEVSDRQSLGLLLEFLHKNDAVLLKPRSIGLELLRHELSV